jgi:metallo-beta-lactamase class B
MKRVQLGLAALFVCLGAAALLSKQQSDPVAVKPFKVIGNIYYVGTDDPTSFLITTPAGHILLDSTYEQTAPIVLSSIQALGFKPADVKILLSSHSHFDHVGGHAAIVKATGAEVYATAEDAVNLESGGATAFHRIGSFTPVKVAKRLKDGEAVTLGGVSMVAHLTPGHTEGNTAWTMTVEENGKKYAVLFASSMSINPGVHMVNYAPWPDIAEAYARSFRILKSLPCDVFLGPHAGFFDLRSRMGRLGTANGPNPFVDPEARGRYLAYWEKNYENQIKQEKLTK